jgi:hypothetical protein
MFKGVVAKGVSDEFGIPPDMAGSVVKHLDMDQTMKLLKLVGPLAR